MKFIIPGWMIAKFAVISLAVTPPFDAATDLRGRPGYSDRRDAAAIDAASHEVFANSQGNGTEWCDAQV